MVSIKNGLLPYPIDGDRKNTLFQLLSLIKEKIIGFVRLKAIYWKIYNSLKLGTFKHVNGNKYIDVTEQINSE